jgi:hypothetical protein
VQQFGYQGGEEFERPTRAIHGKHPSGQC